MSTLLEEVRKFSVDEAVSPAQQAAIAISKKERGEKPKNSKDEGNAFGMALKSARDKGDKTFVVSGRTYEVEDYDVQEDGHTDVASAQNNVKVAMSALTKMSGELAKLNPEDALPSWWTNKVAVAVDKLDGMADYLDTQVEALDTEDEPKVKEIIKKLKGASKAHAGQADDLEKAVKEEVELEEKFKLGDKVKVKKGSMKSPSQRHYETTVGTIVKDYGDDDFKVNFGGNDDLSIEGKLLVKTQVEESLTEEQFDEKAGEKDACYRKVKSRYKVWPSAYASGALVKCRKVGAANWGNSKKK